MQRRVVAGVGLTWEPPPPERLEDAGATWELWLEPMSHNDIGRATAAAVDEHKARLAGLRVIDLAELPIGGLPATRILLHALAPAGPVCLEQWRVDAVPRARLIVMSAQCPVAAYDALADEFAAAATSLRVLG